MGSIRHRREIGRVQSAGGCAGAEWIWRGGGESATGVGEEGGGLLRWEGSGRARDEGGGRVGGGRGRWWTRRRRQRQGREADAGAKWGRLRWPYAADAGAHAGALTGRHSSTPFHARDTIKKSARLRRFRRSCFRYAGDFAIPYGLFRSHCAA